MKLRCSVVGQPQRLGACNGIGDGADAQSFVDQLLPCCRIAAVQAHVPCRLEVSRQHLNQQDIASVSRLGVGRLVEPLGLCKRQFQFAVQGVGQGQIAAAVELGGGQRPCLSERLAGGGGITELRLGDPQAIECIGGLQGRGGCAEQGLGPLWITQTQLGGAQAEQAFGILGIECQRLLKSLLGRLSIAALQMDTAKPVPDFGSCFGRLRSAQVERGRCAGVATLFDIAGQLHQPRVAAITVDRRGGAAAKDEAGQQQWKDVGIGQGRRSSGFGSLHSIGRRLGIAVSKLRNLVVNTGERLSIRAFAQDSRGYAAACLLSLGLPLMACAQVQPEWAEQPYAYVVIDQDVRSVLEAFGRNLGVPMAISAKVDGKAPANLRGDTAGGFLEKLASDSGLSWFSDGRMLHVSTEEELQLRQFGLDRAAVEELQASLDALGVAGRHLSLRSNLHGDGVMVSGPPAFMALVQQRVDQLQPAAQPEPLRERGVKVFRGSAAPQLVSEADIE